MTPDQKGGQFSGFYTDEFGTKFNWKCKESDSGGSSGYDKNRNGQGPNSLSNDVDEFIEKHPWYRDYMWWSKGEERADKDFSTQGNTVMEVLLWITYCSGFFWIIGLPV